MGGKAVLLYCYTSNFVLLCRHCCTAIPAILYCYAGTVVLLYRHLYCYTGTCTPQLLLDAHVWFPCCVWPHVTYVPPLL